MLVIGWRVKYCQYCRVELAIAKYVGVRSVVALDFGVSERLWSSPVDRESRDSYSDEKDIKKKRRMERRGRNQDREVEISVPDRLRGGAWSYS
eukprot:scaffold11039_cov122-Skeletonema_menzelii.AAC.2